MKTKATENQSSVQDQAKPKFQVFQRIDPETLIVTNDQLVIRDVRLL